MSVIIMPFGKTEDGLPVRKYTLSGPDCSVSVLDWGATLQSVVVPGSSGPVDILLGFDTIEGYEAARGGYLGAFVGRVANRIDGGRFTFEGRDFALAQNDVPRPNTLHGGTVGWNQKIFRLEEADDAHLVFSLESPDGEEGFPGRVNLRVTYALVDGGFSLEWQAESDRATPLAPTCHAYWNLAGHGSGSICDQELELFAEGYTPVNEALIPTGEIRPVEGTPFDFRTAKPIGRDIRAGDEQLRIAGGYDHNFAIRGDEGILRTAAKAFCPETGITMTMSTTLPGVQLYTGNFVDLDGAKAGASYKKNGAFCLEPQYFPDFVNHPDFVQGVVRPGQPQTHCTQWLFTSK